MVSFSNGSLSNEVNKRPLENGCMPQFKPRKVSAIRDFPPGCGPNAVPKNLRREEVCGSGAGGKDTKGVVSFEPTNTSVEHQSREEVSSSSALSFRDWAGVNGSTDMPVSETLDTLMEKAKASVTVSKELVMGIGSVGTKIRDDAASHKQETINNPVEIERDEQLGTYVGNVETTVINGLPNQVQEMMLERDLVGVDIVNNMKTLGHSGDHTVLEELKEDKSLASFMNSGVELVKSPSNSDVSTGKDHLLENPLVFSASCRSIQSGTFMRPRDKYRPRRVSAVRDFPPNCGTNVSSSIEGERDMATPGKDSLNRTEAVESMPEPTVLIDGIVRKITGEILTSSGECVDGLHNVHVEIEKSETLNDDAGREFLGEIKVATAEVEAMEFEECSIDLQHGITQDIGARAGSSTISKALVTVEDARRPVGKETYVSSPDRNDEDRPPHSDFSFWNNSNRELVHGLMAAPNCPWRKSKGAFNSRDDLKTRKQNVPLSQKPNDVALNSNLEANSSGYPTLKNANPDLRHGYRTPGKSTFIDEGDHGAGSGCIRDATPISMYKPDVDSSDNVYSPVYSDEEKNSQNSFGSKDDVDREVVHGLMAAPHCPWRKEKATTPSSEGTGGGKKRKQNFSWRQKAKAVATKSKPEIQSSVSLTKKKNNVHMSNDVGEGPNDLAVEDDKDLATNYRGNHKREAEICLPQFAPKTSGLGDARIRVREVLRLFNGMCRKLLQQDEADPAEGEEGKSKQSGRKARRIDLIAAQNLKDKKISVNTVKMIGSVPGVEVGDEFQYRVELAVVGIHFPYQSGIDSAKFDDVPLATSIVTSGAYFDDVENADVLRYSGQGGNVVGKCKVPEDQKMERGNLALKNCIATKTPVRVVRGWKEMKVVDPLDSKPKLVTTYVYDGLYTVTNYGTEKGPHGKQVFMFELKRNPGQPELAWKELKKSTKFKKRPGVCVDDISVGKECIPIWAVNTVDDDKPPSFNYISKRMYPEWYRPKPAAGCDCVGNCSIRKKCKCILRNGGEIPYNHNGALVETKTLVYECGPHCKCPPSCYNRSTQRGIKFQLEVFKTESRGWGVRALTSITSGSFICEYAGELLEDKEAEKRIGNDEYLFDIANPEDEEDGAEPKEIGMFTIDAKTYGNVGRFINHSCAPNLYAQNVIYDNNDKRMPHVMLFAMENIPPLTELTYSYNYSLGQIRDSEGNIKVKKCYCGAAGCTGRLY